MPRVRSPNRDKAFDIYKQHKGNITNREIAKTLDVSEKTISGWKAKDKWNDKLNGVLQKDLWSTPKENKKNNSIKKDSKNPIEEEVKEILENANITDKQRLFCAYYINSLNATQSYMRAYDCTYEIALVNGPRLLGNARVKDQLQKLKEIKINSVLIDKYDVLEFLGKALKANMDDFQEERDGGIYKKSNCDGTLIHSIKEGKYGIEIKLYDKTKIAEMLINILGITPKDIASIMQIEANTKLLNVKAEEVEGRLF